MRGLAPSLLAVLLGSLLVSCASDDAGSGSGGSAPPPGHAPTPDQPIAIQGAWAVESIAGALETVTPPAGPRQPVIEFGPMREDGRAQLSGMAGVNRFFGDYVFSPGEGAIGGLTIGQLGSTRMAGPPEMMEFEATLLETLKTARTVRRDGDGLVIDCTDAEIRLRRVGGRR